LAIYISNTQKPTIIQDDSIKPQSKAAAVQKVAQDFFNNTFKYSLILGTISSMISVFSPLNLGFRASIYVGFGMGFVFEIFREVLLKQ